MPMSQGREIPKIPREAYRHQKSCCENQRDLVGKNGTLRDFAGLLRTNDLDNKKGLQVIDFLATL
jgi:hypothetical protein